jgi:ABC-type methionine transport system permease subunit
MARLFLVGGDLIDAKKHFGGSVTTIQIDFLLVQKLDTMLMKLNINVVRLVGYNWLDFVNSKNPL